VSTERDPDDDSRGRAAATESAEPEQTDEADETAKSIESVDRESHTVYGCGTK